MIRADCKGRKSGRERESLTEEGREVLERERMLVSGVSLEYFAADSPRYVVAVRRKPTADGTKGGAALPV